ncbi:protocatechuate 3,4-dioxygenase subunit alpha [Deinococcus sonorensis]|uniref:Protocatechuate 3,4-dioxygenase subunit alpha n=2 Tax=Deinococcus sonorensis TaxID=309891 RepID=A0AAU7U5R8_9DEIO
MTRRSSAGPLTPEDSNIPDGAFGPSPSQTVGPYFHQGLVHGFQGYERTAGTVLVDPFSVEAQGVPGERIRLTGHVLDADGEVIPDALIEVWQADASGRYPTDPDAAFSGFARTHTLTADARYEVHTIKPGAAGPDAAPRLLLWVGLRGLLTHLYTVVYFSDEDNSRDAVLRDVPEARRPTLIAQRLDAPGGVTYTFDLRLQGEGETVFFTP